MAKELNSVFVKHIWKLVPLPKEKTPVDTRCVFRSKGKSEECNFHVRLVAKSYCQASGSDCEETFRLVAW